jgi:hypothetical protein
VETLSNLSSTSLARLGIKIPSLTWISAALGVACITFCIYLFTYQQILRGKIDHLSFELGMYKAQIQSLGSEDHALRIQAMDVRLDRVDAVLSAILQEQPFEEIVETSHPQAKRR